MYWPYLVVIVLLGGFMLFSVRNRKRQVAEEQLRVSRIGVGTEVMTTSGLYGTVVAKHDDDTVLLHIAPGVEVKWASAALRDADSLSQTYRRALDANASDGDGEHRDPTAAPAADPSAGGDSVELRKRSERPGEPGSV